MMRTARAVLAAGLCVCAAAVPAAAQWAGGGTPREGACFYKDADFRGAHFCIEAGDSRASLSSRENDEVSSIRVLGRAEVVVYEGNRFRGESMTVTRDVRDLDREDFNDRISSVEVLTRGGGGFGGGNRPQGGGNRDPDRIIDRAYQDMLERDPDPSGRRLYRSRIIDDGWTEQQVREDLRQSPEYRELHTMTNAKAREIVRRAYLAVLTREPDAGSSGFVTRVMRDRWTQQDVERELRNSDEYRNRPR